jgi:hypothetical protein
MRLVARTAFSTRPHPGGSPCSERGRNGKFLDYCSRDLAPQFNGASRNRETTYRRQMAPLARFVKQRLHGYHRLTSDYNVTQLLFLISRTNIMK